MEFTKEHLDLIQQLRNTLPTFSWSITNKYYCIECGIQEQPNTLASFAWDDSKMMICMRCWIPQKKVHCPDEDCCIVHPVKYYTECINCSSKLDP